MEEPVVTKEQIAGDLRRLGLNQGDVVMVHSALSSIGRVDGGAETVIEALLEVLSPSGTLLMPCFANPFAPEPFDIENTPSLLGAITETFRRYPGVIRSFHPTHSVAAWGMHAEELVKDHLESPTACGAETPYGRLIRMGGKILLLGVDNDRNTILHTLEEYVKAPYLSDLRANYVDEEGNECWKLLKLFPGPHRNFIALDPLFRREGVESVGKVGNAVARLIDARKMHDVVLDAFRSEPELMLCDNPNCADCVMQRGRVRTARLEDESFTLSALASSVSAFPEEIAYELERAGTGELIVDRLYGQPVWMLEEKQVKRASATLAEDGVKVGAVYCSPEIQDFERCVKRAIEFGADTLIVPFPAEPGRFMDAAKANSFEVFFENTAMMAKTCLDILQGLGACKVLAFNPASFALMGEKPFLGAYRGSRLRHHIGMLYLADATFGGRYTPPGQGNGEVKEMLSILRCKSFSGRVVIATGPGGPGFRELVEGFWALMETM